MIFKSANLRLFFNLQTSIAFFLSILPRQNLAVLKWELLYLFHILKIDFMNPIIKKNAITYGVILGVFSILITAVIYAIDLELFTSSYLGIFSLVVSLAVGIILLQKTKKELGGFMTFKEAFTTYFIAGVIGAAISVLFSLILFNFVDPEAKDALNDLTTKFALETMQKWGAPEAAIDESRKTLAEKDNYSPASLLQGLMFSFILTGIMAAILGLIFRNKKAYVE